MCPCVAAPSLRFLRSATVETKRKEALEKDRAAEFSSGPLSVLLKAVKRELPVLINVRNGHKLFARVRAFDRHCNM